MRVFVCGDIHGTYDYRKIKRFRKTLKAELTLDDYLIVCGDFGLFGLNAREDAYMLRAVYKEFPCTILWIDGNHENFTKLYDYPTEEWKGGKVHRVTDRIVHLQRGEIFELGEGFKIFAFGGAKSTDRGYDTGDYYAWWPEELPNIEQIDYGLNTLVSNDNKIDYIFTHDCSKKVLNEMFDIDRGSDAQFSKFLDFVAENVEFKHWYFGHHHVDKNVDKYSCLYNNIIELTN